MHVFLTRCTTFITSRYVLSAIAFAGIMLCFGCSENYDLAGVNSPDPGVLRIYIKSDDTDRDIYITGDSLTVGEGPFSVIDGYIIPDFMTLVIGQARAYSDTNHAVIFKDLTEYRELDSWHNIIELDSVGAYREFMIFESYLPPDVYDSLKIAISAEFISIGYYQIPIEMPPDAEYLAPFYEEFEILENGITEIHLVLKPFDSLVRVKNTYQFLRLVTVNEILYLPS